MLCELATPPKHKVCFNFLNVLVFLVTEEENNETTLKKKKKKKRKENTTAICFIGCC